MSGKSTGTALSGHTEKIEHVYKNQELISLETITQASIIKGMAKQIAGEGLYA